MHSIYSETLVLGWFGDVPLAFQREEKRGKIRVKGNQFSIKANLGFVLRGTLDALNAFAEDLEDICKERGLIIAFKEASASRLWIKGFEDEEKP